MNTLILNKEEIYLRLIEEEYSNQLSRMDRYEGLPKDEVDDFKNTFISKVKQIILEEKREILDLDIKVITSSELKIGFESGYDGTALYLNSQKNNLEELYIISQGSQDIKDWEYNAQSMLAGINTDQAHDTAEFIHSVKKKLRIEDDTPIIGLAHSLAHNNI